MSNSLKNKKISFIGGGNMAQALISGLLAKGILPEYITVSDPNPDNREQLQAKGINTIDSAKNPLDALMADVVVLAVKPQIMSTVVADFSQVLDKQLIISVAAGLSTDSLIKMLNGYQNIVRAMPNTPAMVQAGATGLYAADSIDEQEKQLTTELMGASGLVIWVDDEEQLHAVTAVSGSAPAYFFYFIESVIQGGIDLGLSQEQASALAMQTALGAAKMSISSDDTPEQLRRKVMSPGGTTEAAVHSLQADKVNELIGKAMQACVKRSREMSGQN